MCVFSYNSTDVITSYKNLLCMFFPGHDTIKTSGTVYANVFPEEQNKTERQKTPSKPFQF